jgi:hypothetical protein
MKAVIRDTDTLKSMAPLEVTAYLRSRNWRLVHHIADKGAVWVLSLKDGEEVEVLLPLDRTLRDYAQRMGDLLQVLGKVEERSQLEILTDINFSTADVVRFKLKCPAIDDGSIPIECGVQLVEQAYSMILAAACATVQPRPVYQTRKSQQAVDYMRKVRLGQTERGSYVLTAYSVVSPHLQVHDQERLFEVEEPFERQVILKLSTALNAVRKAAEEAGANGDLLPFTEAVNLGVSANLCEAITKLMEESEAQFLKVSFSWSPTRTSPLNANNLVALSSDTIPVIKEAARIFRARTPLEDVEIQGWVVKLASTDVTQEGRITVAAEIEGGVRQIHIDLNAEEYARAVEAHRQGQQISCIGNLGREGRSYALHNTTNFKVENEDQ